MNNIKPIDIRISDTDRIICDNIDQFKIDGISSALIAHNVLAQLRNLVEAIVVKIHLNGPDVSIDNIKPAIEFLKTDSKYLFIRKFHHYLQESKSHYTPDYNGAERLMLKYYYFLLELRSFVKQEFGMTILSNLEVYKFNSSKLSKEYYVKIAEKIEKHSDNQEFNNSSRFYVYKEVPFEVKGKIYYEITLIPAYNTASKFDRFICYSKNHIPNYYSVGVNLETDSIIINNSVMPIQIIKDFIVSIRPCEFNNFSKILGIQTKISNNLKEYSSMMNFLTRTSINLYDIVSKDDKEYQKFKKDVFNNKTNYIEQMLDYSRTLIINKSRGYIVLSYLLHTFNNRIIKKQTSLYTNNMLSGLFLLNGCIPFETMPYATSLIDYNPEIDDLLECIECNGRDHELISRYITNNMINNQNLYTSIDDLSLVFNNIDEDIKIFESLLYSKHKGRKIERFGKYLYKKEAFEQTQYIIEKLLRLSSTGINGYEDTAKVWIDNHEMNSDEKKRILPTIFSNSHVGLIYGAAGTGKTYLLNIINHVFYNSKKLLLANTNPAVDNLKRNINSINVTFSTIYKVLRRRDILEYDVLAIDECSMVSNSDMYYILNKIKFKVLILCGDTYQIESIVFGNWFSLAQYFLPKHSLNMLTEPYRTKDGNLLDLWSKVRERDDDLDEYLTYNRYTNDLNDSIFNKEEDDEIILCLNYDGFYGINNINRYIQNKNPSKSYYWEHQTYKVGDRILFNENERFAPAIYNNLKGLIIDIKQETNRIWFTIEIEKALTELDVGYNGLELLGTNNGKSTVRFRVVKKQDKDDDNDIANETDVPFQVAYAVSIHKAQGLEYDSVKIIITDEVGDYISHNIFYTAITRTRKKLMIYWPKETQNKILESFKIKEKNCDASVFSEQTKIKIKK